MPFVGSNPTLSARYQKPGMDGGLQSHPLRQLLNAVGQRILYARNKRSRTGVVLLLGFSQASAQDEDALAEMARKAQDPLGNVRALMTDNTIAFDAGPDDDTSYGFQLQPVYAIQNETKWNMIARGIVPIMGFEPGVVIPRIGPDPRPQNGSSWGIGDSFFQFIFSPKSDARWKWGIGPQASLKTQTSDRQAGPGWGMAAWPFGVAFGGVGDWALGAIAMQHWGEGNFSVGTLQLIGMYNFPDMPGTYLGYNNSVTFNWEATSGNKVTLPLGATFGKTMLLGNGDGLDLSVGVYGLVEKPDNAPSWQLKFGISYFFN